MAQFDGMTAASCRWLDTDGCLPQGSIRLHESCRTNKLAAIEAAVDALHNPPSMYGFVAPNKVDENFMSQVLEHVFLANGVSPVSTGGFAPLDAAPLKKFWISTRKFLKHHLQVSCFWKQSREIYFAGNAAMIIWSPFILDELAGLRDSAPPTINDDPTSTELASKTGIVTIWWPIECIWRCMG